jgi:hypothetical protein
MFLVQNFEAMFSSSNIDKSYTKETPPRKKILLLLHPLLLIIIRTESLTFLNLEAIRTLTHIGFQHMTICPVSVC